MFMKTICKYKSFKIYKQIWMRGRKRDQITKYKKSNFKKRLKYFIDDDK